VALEALVRQDRSNVAHEINILGGGIDVLDSQPLQWVCRCSQAKIESTLYSLGPANLREMLEEDGQAEVICHFGNKAWMVDGPRLQELLDAHKGTPEA